MQQTQKLSNKFILFIVIIIAILISAVSVGISLTMRPRLPDQVTICGVDLSDMLVTDAELILENQVKNYSLNVTAGEQSFYITAEDLDLLFLKDKFAETIQSVNESEKMIDPMSFISFDKGKLELFIRNQFDEKRISAVSPEIGWDSDKQCFFVIEGKPETWYSTEILTEKILDAVMDFSSEAEIDNDALYQESVDTERLGLAETLVNRANELMNLEFEYVFAPRKIELGRTVIDRATIASFLRFNMDEKLVYADADAVRTYAEEFRSQYEYKGYRDQFVTHGGDRINLGVYTKNRSVDIDAFAKQIADNITNGVAGSHEVPYTNFVNFEGKYIEVCIPEQHLWVYENGEVIFDSIVVTGIHGVRDTPTGVFAIGGHLTNIFLQEGYFVEYWMSFSTDGMYGFHDGDHWRKPEDYAFGTYMINGSSGCVNVPVANMAKLYEIVSDGTLVAIYDYYHYN